MPDKSKWLPAAAEDVALAAKVNARIQGHAHVTFMRRDLGDDMIEYGLVLAYHDARKPIVRQYPFFDADEVVKLFDEWLDELGRYQEANNWVIAR